MLVYGDPSTRRSLRQMRDALHARVSDLARQQKAGADALDVLRSSLISAGQLEQATADGLKDVLPDGDTSDATIAQLAAIPDAFASSFYGLWSSLNGPVAPAPHAMHDEALADFVALPGWSIPLPDDLVTVKLPEGFAFYALYPEQYCVAAERWLADHAEASAQRAVVIGVRSIGTTLSAVVAAVLNAHGWHVERRTVRPTGHPFSRQASLAPMRIAGDVHALVVDEGPGISGSSMVAAARALVEAGVERARIAFFPGHAGAPGGAASDEVRDWWRDTPKYVVPLDQMRWRGRPLSEALADATARLLDGAIVDRIEDLSAGNWRRVVYRNEQEWPAVCATFERTKYLCRLCDGRALLWKFAGLQRAEEDRRNVIGNTSTLSRLAKLGWTVEPLGSALGFVALPWTAARPLTRDERNPALMEQIGQYIVDCAGPPMEPSEAQEALSRLIEMLNNNAREGLDGQQYTVPLDALASSASQSQDGSTVPTYGDGHLAPHEWLQTPEGRILKTDCGGHAHDHTLVGRQPVLWDIAAALVEWDCDAFCADALFRGALRNLDATTPSELMRFYRAAYSAFRMGQCQLCGELSGTHSAERARLLAARDYYRDHLIRACTVHS